jgi:pyruvate/2-oxoglutarate dehydrogenase complex dihydrolipoamide dehydrogenase (E3) component
MASVLPKDDPEAVAIVRRALLADGIALHEATRLVGVAGDGGAIALHLEDENGDRRIEASHLLIAAGRRPAVEGLGLDKAGVALGKAGIAVDEHMRTSNRRIYAIGDVTGSYPFTHMAGHHAGIVIRHMLFRLPAKVERRAVPWITFTEPELAQGGLSEAAALAEGRPINLLRAGFSENDRARTERSTDGFVKLVVSPGGRVLGATIVGESAGDPIQPWILAVKRGLKVSALADLIQPYPTRGETAKRAAAGFFIGKLFSARTRKLVQFLLRLP